MKNDDVVDKSKHEIVRMISNACLEHDTPVILSMLSRELLVDAFKKIREKGYIDEP